MSKTEQKAKIKIEQSTHRSADFVPTNCTNRCQETVDDSTITHAELNSNIHNNIMLNVSQLPTLTQTTMENYGEHETYIKHERNVLLNDEAIQPTMRDNTMSISSQKIPMLTQTSIGEDEHTIKIEPEENCTDGQIEVDLMEQLQRTASENINLHSLLEQREENEKAQDIKIRKLNEDIEFLNKNTVYATKYAMLERQYNELKHESQKKIRNLEAKLNEAENRITELNTATPLPTPIDGCGTCALRFQCYQMMERKYRDEVAAHIQTQSDLNYNKDRMNYYRTKSDEVSIDYERQKRQKEKIQREAREKDTQINELDIMNSKLRHDRDKFKFICAQQEIIIKKHQHMSPPLNNTQPNSTMQQLSTYQPRNEVPLLLPLATNYTMNVPCTAPSRMLQPIQFSAQHSVIPQVCPTSHQNAPVHLNHIPQTEITGQERSSREHFPTPLVPLSLPHPPAPLDSSKEKKLKGPLPVESTKCQIIADPRKRRREN